MTQDPAESLVAASFSARVLPDSPEIKRFVQAIGRCQAVRRLGSAALNLCYVASGALDGYWATSVKLWDVAAGLLIVQESGGHVRSIDQAPFDWDDPRFICTGTDTLGGELFEALSLPE
jgi:myo-inositol-1(or 4)-monophosphatase